MPVEMRHQLDRNAGRAGGLLLAVMQEPTGYAGLWELFTSRWLPEPDGVLRSTPWIPRSSQVNPLREEGSSHVV